MFKWLENIIKNSIVSAIKENPTIFRTSHMVLSREHPNIIDIDCGQMPKAKAEKYLQDQMQHLQFLKDKGYIILLRSVFR